MELSEGVTAARSAGDRHTRVLVRRPCDALRGIVRRFVVVESTAAHRDAHLPDTGLVAAFRFRGTCLLDGRVPAPRAAITGLWDRARAHEHSADHAVVIAAFTPLGAAQLLRRPLDAFANATVDLIDLDVLGGRGDLAAVHDRLADAADHAERVRLVEELLLDRVDRAGGDPLVAAAVEMIERTGAAVRIETLARRIGLSQSALERRFRRAVGAAPRRFASLVRLQHAIRLRAAGADLTTVAHAAGYSDQPHFIHDFKRFAGVPPGAFFDSRSAG